MAFELTLVASLADLFRGLPWASSFDSDFNFDFDVQFSEEQQREGGIEDNYRRETAWQRRGEAEGDAPEDLLGGAALRESGGDPVAENAAMTGTDVATYTRERPGMSAFALVHGVDYHTYSTYSRGLDALWGMYQWLDRAPRGRNETGMWWRRHDEYDGAGSTWRPAAGASRCGERKLAVIPSNPRARPLTTGSTRS